MTKNRITPKYENEFITRLIITDGTEIDLTDSVTFGLPRGDWLLIMAGLNVLGVAFAGSEDAEGLNIVGRRLIASLMNGTALSAKERDYFILAAKQWSLDAVSRIIQKYNGKF